MLLLMPPETKREDRDHDSCDDSLPSPSQSPRAAGQKHPLVPTFHYQDLEYAKPFFRLLRLTSCSGPLRCELIHQTFQDGTFIPYEAISYVWGPPDKCKTLMIGDAALPITAGLCRMLKRLRARRHQYIWVDAICINQENTRERNHQVQHMKAIYSSARRVVFYLGEPTGATDLLMEGLWLLQMSLRPVHRRSEFRDGDDWLKHGHDGNYDSRTILDEKWQRARPVGFSSLIAPREMQRSGLQELFARPWFRRVWVIQEASNARQGIVQCGGWAVPCQIFVLAASLLQMTVPHECRDILAAMPTTSRARSWFAANRDLHSLLSMFRHFEATKNQDRIYALLGICAEPANGTKLLSVDYDKPEAEVVRDTVAYISGCRTKSLRRGPWVSVERFLSRLDLIYEQALSTLVQNSEVDCVAFMLQEYPGRVQITQAMVEMAAKDREHGTELVELLLAASGGLQITDPVVAAATKNPTQAAGIFPLLISHHGLMQPLSPFFAAQVAENVRHGEEIAALLSRRMGPRITIARPDSPPLELEPGRWAKTEEFFRRAGVELWLKRANDPAPFSFLLSDRLPTVDYDARRQRFRPAPPTSRHSTFIGNKHFVIAEEPFGASEQERV